MARKKVRRYGDYTQIRDGELYAVVQLPLGNGKYKKKYKKVSSRTEAIQWALGQLEKHKKGTTYDESLTFEEFADWYKEEFLHPPRYEKGLKVEGVKDFERLKNKVDTMKEFFGTRKMSEFSEYDLRRWQKFRQDKVLTATLNRDLSLLRTMFKRALKYRRIQSIPEFEINTSMESARSRVMSFDEEKRLLAACVGTETVKVNKKDGRQYEMTIRAKREHLKAIIIIAVDTAMRLNEIFTLTWNDIDLDNGVITIQATNSKTQLSRKTLTTPRVKKELELLFDGKPGKVFKQKSAARAFRTACARAGIVDLHFHDLRHTAITRMIRAGIPHTEVMKISGHRTLRSFLRYLNIENTTVVSAALKLSNFIESQDVG